MNLTTENRYLTSIHFTGNNFGFMNFSHGRDNKLHVWTRIIAIQSLGDAANQRESKLPEPTLQYSLDVNALNFCKFSLLPVKVSIDRTPPPQIPSTSKLTTEANHAVALLAIPNLVDSSLVRCK